MSISALYTVQIGDSLSKLSKKFYGDPSKYPVIAEANKISPHNILVAGMRLHIPSLPTLGDAVEEVTVTNEMLRNPGSGTSRVPVPESTPVQPGYETIVVTASVWYKDWRYWAAIAAGISVVWYFSSRRR